MGLVYTSASTQNEIDALRYSMLNYGGTARFNSMAGAFGALGADISTLSTNPAGIAVYRKSEFTFTPGYSLSNADANYYGNTMEDNKYNVNINNIGWVGTIDLEDEDAGNWKKAHFGFAYNRINNFHNDIVIRGENQKNSLLDVFLSRANGVAPEELPSFTSALAYQAYLLDPDPDTLVPENTYVHALTTYGVTQTKSVYRKGRMGETVITFGGNYDDRLYLGFTIGFPSIRFNEQSVHAEDVLNDSLVSLERFEYKQDLETRGLGVNFKFGVIGKVSDWMRVGATFHSPSWFSLTDEYTTVVESRFDDGSNYEDASPLGQYGYRLHTPARVMGSVAFIIGKYGLLSAEYEFVDYTTAKLKSGNGEFSDSYSFVNENLEIKNQYTATNNLRIGGEIRLQPFTIRGGVALYESPFDPNKDLVDNDASRTMYTFGVGYRNSEYFIDLAYSLTQWSEDYYLYDPVLIPAASVNTSLSQVSATIGFRF